MNAFHPNPDEFAPALQARRILYYGGTNIILVLAKDQRQPNYQTLIISDMILRFIDSVDPDYRLNSFIMVNMKSKVLEYLKVSQVKEFKAYIDDGSDLSRFDDEYDSNDYNQYMEECLRRANTVNNNRSTPPTPRSNNSETTPFKEALYSLNSLIAVFE